MNINRTTASVADQNEVKKIHHQAYHDVVVKQFGGWDENLQEKFFIEKWVPEKIQLLYLNQDLIGYLIVEKNENDFFLCEIVISPDHQRKGLGSFILKEEIKKAKDKNLPIKLQVLKANKARQLYPRLGFCEYGTSSTHILMEKVD